MIGKYRRYEMIGAINYWCSKNELSYFTYIEKKTKSELEAIIAQYDINVDEMLFESAKQRESVENSKQNLKSIIKKNIDFLLDKIKMLESLLNDEQKEEYNEFLVTQNSN